MPRDEMLTALLWLGPVVYFATFAHEAGHALLGRLAGLTVTSFGVGLGKPVLSFGLGGTRVFFGARRPLQGITFMVMPQIFPSRWALVAGMAGGVVANMVLAVVGVALALWLPWGRTLWLMTAVVNLLLGLPNLIPFTVHVGKVAFRTDGAQLLRILRSGLAGSAPGVLLQNVQMLEGFWEAVGDTRVRRAYLLRAAAIWADLGDPLQAGVFLERAAALPHQAGGVPPGYVVKVRAQVAIAAGRLPEAAAALDEAEALFIAEGHEAGLCLTALTRSGWALASGDVAAALACIERVARSPLAAERPALRCSLVEVELCARAAAGAGPKLRALRDAYEALRGSDPSPSTDRSIYRALAVGSATHGDWEQAAADYRRAVAAARQVLEELPDAGDRERFRACQQPLLAEAARCLEQLGKPEEAAKVTTVLPPAEEVESARIAGRELRDRVYRRMGWRLAGINLTLGLATFAAFLWLLENPLGGSEYMLPVLAILAQGAQLLLYGMLGSLVGMLGHWLALRTNGRRTYGKALLGLQLLPWLMAPLVLALAIHFAREP